MQNSKTGGILYFIFILLISIIPYTAAAQDYSDSWAVRYADSVIQRWPHMSNLESDWCYEAGFVLHGMQQVYRLTGDLKYFNYIREFIDSHIGSSGYVSYTSSTLDDYLPARQLLFLFEQTGEEIYMTKALRFRNSLENVSRNSFGGFWHKANYPNQMWCDGQYMAIPFLIHYGYVQNNFSYPADETHKQMTLLINHAQVSNGLLYHGWDASLKAAWADHESGLSPEFWGRGLGWFSMALVDILDYFPVTDSRYNDILACLKLLVSGLANVQDNATGLWYQVLDKCGLQSNWLESSCSAMFVYSIHKAVRLGYVDQSYLKTAEDGFNGIINHKITVDSSGYIELHDIVQGMGVQTSYSGYVNQARLTNSHHGLGAFLLAASEILLEAASPLPTPVPSLPPEIKLGDANSDGIINIIDALVTAQYYVGIPGVQINLAASDVNCDKAVNIVDALIIAQYYVGIITHFTGC